LGEEFCEHPAEREVGFQIVDSLSWVVPNSVQIYIKPLVPSAIKNHDFWAILSRIVVYFGEVLLCPNMMKEPNELKEA
jgi:hypothetical protein